MSTNTVATKNFNIDSFDSKTVTVSEVEIPEGGPVTLIADTNTDRAEINLAYYNIESLSVSGSGGSGQTKNIGVSADIKNIGGNYGARRDIIRTSPAPSEILKSGSELSVGSSATYSDNFAYTFGADGPITVKTGNDSESVTPEATPAKYTVEAIDDTGYGFKDIEIVPVRVTNSGGSQGEIDVRVELENRTDSRQGGSKTFSPSSGNSDSKGLFIKYENRSIGEYDIVPIVTNVEGIIDSVSTGVMTILATISVGNSSSTSSSITFDWSVTYNPDFNDPDTYSLKALISRSGGNSIDSELIFQGVSPNDVGYNQSGTVTFDGLFEDPYNPGKILSNKFDIYVPLSNDSTNSGTADGLTRIPINV